jgi:transposase
MPLWSRVIIGDWLKSIGKEYASLLTYRVTNNPVECYFKHLKYLLKGRHLACSELMALLYERLEAKHLKYFGPETTSALATSRCWLTSSAILSKIV